MLSVAFTFLYWFLPNAGVRVVSAAIGGVFAGIAVTLAQSVYVHFSVGVARADALFGSFALLPLLFAWIYVFWAIVLLGAEIAFAHQNFALYRQEVQSALRRRPAEREAIALQIALDVARCFGAGEPAPHAEALADDAPGAGAHGARGRGAARRRGDPLDARRRARPGARRSSSGARPSRSRRRDVLAAVRGRRKPIAGHRATGEHGGRPARRDRGRRAQGRGRPHARGAAARLAVRRRLTPPPHAGRGSSRSEPKASEAMTVMRIYLDHNATTPVRDEVAAAMLRVLRDVPGNPSSVHAEGAAARAELDLARERTAELLGVAPARGRVHGRRDRGEQHRARGGGGAPGRAPARGGDRGRASVGRRRARRRSRRAASR